MAKRPEPPPRVHPSNNNWVHRSFLAPFLRLSEQRLDQLAKMDSAAHPRVKVAQRAPVKGYFLFADTVGELREHQEEVSAGRSTSDAQHNVAAESAQLKRAQRERVEMQMSRDRGELVDSKAVLTIYSELVKDTRTAVLGIPGRVQGELPHMVASEVEAVKRVCRETLEELKRLGDKPPAIPVS